MNTLDIPAFANLWGRIKLLSASKQFAWLFTQDSMRFARDVAPCPVAVAQHTVDLQIQAKPEMIAYVRQQVTDIAESMPFTSNDIDDIKIAVGEAITNAIKHNGSPRCDAVDVKIERDQTELKISISDSGCGFDPCSVKITEPGSLVEGGRGIWLMRALMDEVDFIPTHPGTRVELTKRAQFCEMPHSHTPIP